MSITDENVKRFIRERIFERSPIFLQLEAYAAEHYVPIIQPETASFLKQIVHLKKPARILEIGTAIGYSAMVFASACSHDVHIDTIEKSPEMVELAKKNIDRSRFAKYINVIEGEATAVLKKMDQEYKYDLIFIDAAKGQYMKFFELALNFANEDCIIICDNVFIQGLVANFEAVERKNRTMVRNMIGFVDMITSDKSFETSLVPIGDGLAIIRLKGSFVK